MSEAIIKVLGTDDWNAAIAKGCYTGSSDDQRDGFIHFSTPDQLPGTIDKHFAGKTNQVLVVIASASLGNALKWEPSRDGQLFPHLYGDLDPALAIKVIALTDGPNGPQLPPKGWP